MCGKLSPRRGWHLEYEAYNDAEGYENSRVDDEGDDPEGADLLDVHVLFGCALRRVKGLPQRGV